MPQSKNLPKSAEMVEKENKQKFMNEYQELCKKRNHQIVVIPIYKARDDGTWSTVLRTGVGRLSKK